MTEYAIIVAGGKGSRMKNDTPKQFLPIGGKPILFHTIEAFRRYSPKIEIIVVLPESQIDLWKKLCAHYSFLDQARIVSGGASRFQSVKCGLDIIKEDGWVAVHDGVRPFISTEVIANAFHTARHKGSAVVSTPLKESIREITDKETTVARNRASFVLVQTPQIFSVKDLKQAYHITESAILTDDASVAEAFGIKIHLVEGDFENIKITTPEDVVFAEAILKERTKKK